MIKEFKKVVDWGKFWTWLLYCPTIFIVLGLSVCYYPNFNWDRFIIGITAITLLWSIMLLITAYIRYSRVTRTKLKKVK